MTVPEPSHAEARRFVSLAEPGGSRQVHCRIVGAGPPLLMLHASPLCSLSLSALAQALAGHATVIALDTPGYGFSDPLPEPPEDIGAYARALRPLLGALGLESAGLYGAATGAQIAIEFAKQFPDATDYVVLDSAASFLDDERESIVSGYFPALDPRADGGHLVQVWQMMRDVFRFFPWHDAREAARVGPPAPPEAAHAAALACLRAGPGYDLAYRAAFENERAERLAPITKPTRVMFSEGSILRRYSARLAEREWPANIHVQHVGAARGQRLAAVADTVAELSAGLPAELSAAGLAAAELPVASAGSLPRSGYVPLADGLCRVIIAGDPRASAVMLLHDAGGDAGEWRERFDALSGDYWVLAPDLPGHGLSDGARRGAARAGPDGLGAWLAQLLDALALPACALAGRGVGAELARQCAAGRPGTTLAMALAGEGPPALPDPERWPDLRPRPSGAHLLEAWHMLRERYLAADARPARDAPSPATLTRELLALFGSAAAVEAAAEAAAQRRPAGRAGA